MTWPTKLEMLSVNNLTDRLGKHFSHWGFFDLRIQSEAPKPEYARNFQWAGNRVTIAGLLFQVGTWLAADQIEAASAPTYPRGVIHRVSALPFVVTNQAAEAVHELLIRADHALCVGIPASRPIEPDGSAPIAFAWGGGRQTAIGLAALGITRLHSSLCPACDYVANLDPDEDEPDEKPGDDED